MALYLLYRGLRDRRYFAGLAERLGFLPTTIQSTGSGAIWFHAVSVGEVFSCVELIRALRAAHPHTRMYVSTTTLAGRETAELKLEGLADGLFFAPLDYQSVVRRVLRRLRPAAVVVLETEIWPNLYREAKGAGASLLVVNGRISDRALPRYQRWSWFFRHTLSFADTIFAQSIEDKRRFVLAGARLDQVKVAGNLKYDFTPPSEGVAPTISGFLHRTQPTKIWIAASTMPPADSTDVDEDDIVLRAFAQAARSHRGLLMVLAPRRPERFDVVAEKLNRAGVKFVRRTKLAKLELPGVMLLDSIGDLAPLFERADVVFMGGTLARRGGHNILEPAYFGKPVIVGPHMENFSRDREGVSRGRGIGKYCYRRRTRSRGHSPSRRTGKAGRERPRSCHVQARSGESHREGSLHRSREWRAGSTANLLARAVLRPLSWCGPRAIAPMSREQLDAAANTGDPGDQHRRPHYGRHRKIADGGASGPSPARTRPQSGDPDARLSSKIA